MKDDPEAGLKLMMVQVMGPAHPKLKQTVAQIQDKYEAILRLEKSVSSLFELFQELATLVKAQGEMIDNVETNLAQTQNYLEKAEVNLATAQTIHNSNKKKICCMIICFSLAGIIGIILLSGVIKF